VSLSLSICVNPTHATSLTHPSAPLKEALSRDSQERLARGSPLRILDSKDERDIDLLKSAPCLSDFLSQDSLSHLDHVKRCLEAADVAYTVDPRLVRGLDYYGHTAFEFVVPDSGRQSAVLAGGRYDLGETLGKTSLPSVGWAMGVDRLIDILPVGVVQPTTPVRVLMPHTESLVAQRELEEGLWCWGELSVVTGNSHRCVRGASQRRHTCHCGPIRSSHLEVVVPGSSGWLSSGRDSRRNRARKRDGARERLGVSKRDGGHSGCRYGRCSAELFTIRLQR